jgi:hypothetical protein
MINQYYKVPGHYLILWQRLFIFLCLFPFAFIIDWPVDPLFYAIIAFTAITATLGDIRFFNVTAKYGGGVVSRIQPLSVWVSFILWFAIEPQQLFNAFDQPFRMGGIILSLAGCVYFASHLRHCKISKDAFVKLSPTVIGYGLNMVLAKYVFGMAALNSGVFAYMFVQTIFAIPICAVFLLKDQKRGISYNFPFKNKTVIWAGFLMCLGWITHMVLKGYASVFAENPGYVSALMLTTPLWISLIYKYIGHKEETNVIHGMGVVACSILLSIFAIS